MRITPIGILTFALCLALVWQGRFFELNTFRRTVSWFHSTTHEDPLMDRTIVEISEKNSGFLEPFRRRTVTDIIDPTVRILASIKDARKSTDIGKNNPSWDSEQILTEVDKMMAQARLRPTPKRYSKDYDDVLWGIYHTTRSARALHRYAESDDPEARKVAYKECYDQSKKAQRKLRKARDYFQEDAKL